MGPTAGQFIAALTANHDVVVIGGLAVIAHGFNRPTKDADVWLDPMESAEAWARRWKRFAADFPSSPSTPFPGWRRIPGTEITEAAEEVGMVRILGLDCPLESSAGPTSFPPMLPTGQVPRDPQCRRHLAPGPA